GLTPRLLLALACHARSASACRALPGHAAIELTFSSRGSLRSDNAAVPARYALLKPVATTERPELVSSGAGLASTVAAETHGELGETTVRARGYWEGVFLRFKRDKFAIGGGVFIIFLVFVGFIGAPIAAHFLGHGPNDQFSGGLDPKTVLPVGPLTQVSEA